MEKLKLYILCRKDAPIGKIIAHVGHVCCSVIRNVSPFYIDKWYNDSDQTKIILEVKNDELRNYYDKFLNILGYELVDMIEDVHTQEFYCVAVGPITDSKAKELGLKKLRLFK